MDATCWAWRLYPAKLWDRTVYYGYRRNMMIAIKEIKTSIQVNQYILYTLPDQHLNIYLFDVIGVNWLPRITYHSL